MHKIGILGGSFDPIHYGHIAIATSALEECGLDKVILMPAKAQPFKAGRHFANEKDRLEMVRLAAENNKGLICSSCEINQEGISYTYNTFQLLNKEYKDIQLHFILGTDSFLGLETWYHGKELLRTVSFILAVRPGYKESETKTAIDYYRKTYQSEITILNNPILYISSTEIRNCVARGDSICRFVPPYVEEYINEHGLYKKADN